MFIKIYGYEICIVWVMDGTGLFNKTTIQNTRPKLLQIGPISLLALSTFLIFSISNVVAGDSWK